MSISPATDIVLDVARAADPARYKRAVAKLDAVPAPGFTEELAAEATAPVSAPAADTGATAARPRAAPMPKATTAATDKAAATYRQFEAMALANMLEAAMPSDDGFFGKGVAGSTWKSMMIDQIATEMAKHGGVGIASELARAETTGRSKTTG